MVSERFSKAAPSSYEGHIADAIRRGDTGFVAADLPRRILDPAELSELKKLAAGSAEAESFAKIFEEIESRWETHIDSNGQKYTVPGLEHRIPVPESP